MVSFGFQRSLGRRQREQMGSWDRSVNCECWTRIETIGAIEFFFLKFQIYFVPICHLYDDYFYIITIASLLIMDEMQRSFCFFLFFSTEATIIETHLFYHVDFFNGNSRSQAWYRSLYKFSFITKSSFISIYLKRRLVIGHQRISPTYSSSLLFGLLL